VTDTGAGPTRPETVTIFEEIKVDSATLLCAVKVNASGVVSEALVLTLKVCVWLPMVTLADAEPPKVAELVSRTRIVCPLVMYMKLAAVYAPPPIETSPPLTLTGTLPVIPVIVTAADCVTVEGAALLAAAKANAFGVESWVVTKSVSDTEPTLSVALTVAPSVGDAVMRTCTY
jgi:hypothetical protein